MKFSAQEEYGLRCLLRIAKASPSTIPEISRAEGLTEPHVAKLLMILRKGGFITSTRGQTGGYALARAATCIVIGDVLAELGGKLYEDDFCERHSGRNDICTHSTNCSIRSLWGKVQESVDQIVNRVTLSDLLLEESGEAIRLHSETPDEIRQRLRNEVHA